MDLKSLSEQSVVVMGASSGIGRATAIDLASRGARVTVSSRDSAAVDELADEIRSSGGDATAAVGDVTDPHDMERVAEVADKTYGGIDTWVHAAGIAMFARFSRTEPDEFRRIVEVNLIGAANGARAALPHLRQGAGAALIFVTSAEARVPLPFQAAYNASKHGADGFISSLRIELKQEGCNVAVTNVMPAAINTPLFGNARSRLGVEPVAPPPLYSPESVARVIAYACEHPSRDLWAGGAGRAALLAHRISARGFDGMLAKVGMRLILTKRNEVPGDNLYAVRHTRRTVAGPFDRFTFRRSLYNWLELHSPLRSVAARLARPPRLRDKFEPSSDEDRRHGSNGRLPRP